MWSYGHGSGDMKMPLVRFTRLTSLVRNHVKTQTTRKPRKRPLKNGDNLHVYVLEKLGMAPIISLKRKKLRDVTLEEAKKDGFDSIEEYQRCIMEMHGCDLDEEFDLIEYDPQWMPHILVGLSTD